MKGVILICMLLINKLLSAGFELLIFSLVPACWWLITVRKQISFAQWIGLKATFPRRIAQKSGAGLV